MVEIVLHDIDSSVLDKLEKLADEGGRTLEEQAKVLLSQAVDTRVVAKHDRRASAERIAAMTPKDVVQTDSTILIREDRDR